MNTPKKTSMSLAFVVLSASGMVEIEIPPMKTNPKRNPQKTRSCDLYFPFS